MPHEQYSSDFSVEDMEKYMNETIKDAGTLDPSMVLLAPDGTVSPSMLFSPGSGNDHFAESFEPFDAQSPYAPSIGYSLSDLGMQPQQTFLGHGGGADSSGFYDEGSPAHSASVASPPPAPTHPAPSSNPSTASLGHIDPRAFAPQDVIDNAWGTLMSELRRIPPVSVSNLPPLQPLPVIDINFDLEFDPNKQTTDSDIADVESQLRAPSLVDPSRNNALETCRGFKCEFKVLSLPPEARAR
ncbi:hypothetical protein IAT38_008149 [Cryptococcus sp. DSM 104549]